MSYHIWCVRTNSLLMLGVGELAMSNIPASLLENGSDAENIVLGFDHH
ncbi:hypothetical protein [Legionella nautarum]|nr:hypothetical protein [Legionella nautarum]